MYRSNITPIACAIVVLCSASVNAAERATIEGPYVGGSLGRTSFSAKEIGLPKTGSDEIAMSGKAYGGYQLTDRFGVEAGYVRLGSLSETVSVGNTPVEQTAKGRSLYVAGTGRMPISDKIALTGKAGISFGKVSGTNALPAANDITGSRRSFMYGLGGEYRVSQHVALTADFDHFGKVSDKVRANMFSVGARYTF
jgi:OmpA-OmpF porin, OOP family